tara:strand:+ start:154 stop:393 length:240 start_codon:yes stop_codon:yes gene_type:complete
VGEKPNKEIALGGLVWLRPSAAGYPMMADPEKELGIGLVIEQGAEEFAGNKSRMVKVLWTRSQTKRWEFIEDLIVIEHT